MLPAGLPSKITITRLSETGFIVHRTVGPNHGPRREAPRLDMPSFVQAASPLESDQYQVKTEPGWYSTT